MLCNLHFLSSKCRLFHNATLFGFCITHILNTGVLKFETKKSVAKRLTEICTCKTWCYLVVHLRNDMNLACWEECSICNTNYLSYCKHNYFDQCNLTCPSISAWKAWQGGIWWWKGSLSLHKASAFCLCPLFTWNKCIVCPSYTSEITYRISENDSRLCKEAR